MIPKIDWILLGKAFSHYENIGYKYIETPWSVGELALKATLPPNVYGYGLWHPKKELSYLVGSAEQGFIQMMLDGKIKSGDKLCSITPCFREDKEDDIHFQYFMKLELIVVGEENHTNVVLNDAARFFNLVTSDVIMEVLTKDGVDLELNGLEIGSYGHRQSNGLSWTYGTGLALPRFSQASKIYQ